MYTEKQNLYLPPKSWGTFFKIHGSPEGISNLQLRTGVLSQSCLQSSHCREGFILTERLLDAGFIQSSKILPA
jgi:hypothetical protein